MDTLDDGAGGRSRQSDTQPQRHSNSLSLRVRQKILKASPRLLRALTTPKPCRETAMQRWAEAELDENDRLRALLWTRDRREQILATAIEELLEHREQVAQRDEAAELAVRRLNQVYEECLAANMTPRPDAI